MAGSSSTLHNRVPALSFSLPLHHNNSLIQQPSPPRPEDSVTTCLQPPPTTQTLSKVSFYPPKSQADTLPLSIPFINMRGLIGLSLLPLLASSAPTFSTETIHEGVAPLLSSSNSIQVPDSYIVVFKKHVTEAAASDHHSWVQDVHLNSENERTELRKRSQFPFTTDIFEGIKHTYNIAGSFLGYSGHFDDSVIEKVRRHPDVSSV
jgi:hypothetical protein